MLGEGRQVLYAPNLLLAVLTYLYIGGLYDLNKISSKKKMYIIIYFPDNVQGL